MGTHLACNQELGVRFLSSPPSRHCKSLNDSVGGTTRPPIRTRSSNVERHVEALRDGGSSPSESTIVSSGCKSVDGSRPVLETGALAHWRFEPSHPDHFQEVGQRLATRFGCESRKGYAGSNPVFLTNLMPGSFNV